MAAFNASYLFSIGDIQTYPILGYSFIRTEEPETKGTEWRTLLGWGIQYNYQRSVLFAEMTDIWAVTVLIGFSYKIK